MDIARRTTLGVLALVAVSLAGLLPVASAAPPTPGFDDAPVDLYGAYPTYTCNASDPHRPGVERFRRMVLSAFPETRSGDAWARCDSPLHMSTSNHHGGRAWDWFIAAEGSRATASERAAPDELVEWLLETVDGEPHMRARRLGIVEIIWFDQLWQSTPGYQYLRPYPLQGCPDPAASNTGCHRDHVHFGFSAAGASCNTTWCKGWWGWWLSTLGRTMDLVA